MVSLSSVWLLMNETLLMMTVRSSPTVCLIIIYSLTDVTVAGETDNSGSRRSLSFIADGI